MYLHTSQRLLECFCCFSALLLVHKSKALLPKTFKCLHIKRCSTPGFIECHTLKQLLGLLLFKYVTIWIAPGHNPWERFSFWRILVAVSTKVSLSNCPRALCNPISFAVISYGSVRRDWSAGDTLAESWNPAAILNNAHGSYQQMLSINSFPQQSLASLHTDLLIFNIDSSVLLEKPSYFCQSSRPHGQECRLIYKWATVLPALN
jgi:hypothetical protein